MARRQGLVALIGAFKLVKASLLIVVGASALVTGPESLAGKGWTALDWLGFNFPLGRPTVVVGLDRLASLDRTKLHELALAVLAYAAVFLVEGVGLLLRKTWAEWLTVVVTASFVPFEIYELVTSPGAGKVATLVINLAIVAYLAWRRLSERRGLRRLVPIR